MTVAVVVNTGEIPSGTIARLADPLGVWMGQADVTGDGSGGNLQVTFTLTAGLERRFVIIIDGVSLETDTATDIGNIQALMTTHHGRANVALGTNPVAVRPNILVDTRIGDFSNLEDFFHSVPIYWQRDFGGTEAERRIVNLKAGTNVNAALYRWRAWGRYYDARIINSRDFWSLFPISVRAA